MESNNSVFQYQGENIEWFIEVLGTYNMLRSNKDMRCTVNTEVCIILENQ